MRWFIRSTLLLGGLAGACHATDTTAPTDLLAPAQPVDPNRVRIVVPEVYELANVIVAMTTYGQASSFLVRKPGEYYPRVRTAFLPYRTDELMDALQLGGDDPLRRYYEFRDNSFAYVYDGDLIKQNPAYDTFWRPNTFRERVAAVQRFADASDFRSFYAANADFYRGFIDRYRDLAEIDSIADWLEREFAPRRFDHYTVALSPLVHASHSTQQMRTSAGTEVVMFVSGPDVTAGTSPGAQKALVQRIVFTEIDHNFVNPVTDHYRVEVTSAFGTRSKWTTDESSFYQSAIAVFNEYMTWAVFLVYIEGRLSAEDFSEVAGLTISTMESSRRFRRFGGFVQELLRLYHERPAGSRIPMLYPGILEWAARQ